MKGKCINYSI